MRKSRLALVAVFLFAVTSLAQGPARWADKLFAGDLSHDFGNVQRGAELKYEFKMTNIYKVPLDITGIKLSCGCLKAEASTKTLKPKETGTITVTMQTKGFSGPGSAKVEVTFSHPDYTSTAALRVSTVSRSELVLTPGEIDFGDLQRGQAVTKHIDIEYTGATRIKEIIKSDSMPCDLKTIALPAAGTSPARSGFRLQATMKADAPSGPFKHEVLLKLDDAAKTVLSFNVVGNVQPKLSASPNPVVFQGAKVGKSQAKKVFVRAATPFRILAVDGLADGITIDCPKDAAGMHVLTVNFRPTKSGAIRRQATIRTDLDKESMRLAIEATVEP